MMSVIDLDEHSFLLLLYPLILFNITANIFFAWSIFLGRAKLKQPLNVLLGYLVFLSILHCVTLVLWHSTYSRDIVAPFIIWAILGVYTHCSVTCYIWLSFYYFVNIVPAKRVLMVWTKKNIKSVIYVALTGETVLYSVSGVIKLTALTSNFNNTNDQTVVGWSHDFFDIKKVFNIITQVYLLFCVLVMMVSSFSTAHYLGKHIRNLAKSASRFTSPKIQSQIRVTIAGVLQGLLYLFYYMFYFIDFVILMYQPKFFFSRRVSSIVGIMFLTATTVNMGISQNVIRQRAADVFSGLKELCGVK